jgi:hypothetical protein
MEFPVYCPDAVSGDYADDLMSLASPFYPFPTINRLMDKGGNLFSFQDIWRLQVQNIIIIP